MKRTAITLIAALLVLFPACEKGPVPEGQGGKTGAKNTTDLAVTGELLGVGMTYADVKGYVNISSELAAEVAANNLVFRVGVWYGESKNSLNRQEFGSYNGREFTVTIPNLKAGKTYYYQSCLEDGNYVPTVEGGWEPYFDPLGKGSEIASFTTKELKYDGSISANEARNITFFQADISGKVDMSSLNAKETVKRGFVWSSSRDAVTGQLASSLDKARYEDTPGDEIVLDVSSGYFVNGNLHFFVGEKAETTLFSEPGEKLYYTPFLIISGTSFTGEPREVTLRSLAQTSGFVDLGLSCLWGASNCGTSSPWEMGINQAAGYDSSDLAKAYGSGMRLPSKAEVEELNQRCTFEAIDNGVLITGPNGNQIFLPGESLEDSYRSRGSLINNTYLSGSTRSEYVLGTWDYYQIGYYYLPDRNMTTSDLPILNYPYNAGQHYYLRPVQDGGSGGGGGGSGGGGGEEDPLSKVLGAYTVSEYYLNGSEWIDSNLYEMEISRMYSSGNMVNISNFWGMGSSMNATVLDSGDISIPDRQYVFTNSSYLDFYAYAFDLETQDLSNTGEILLKYDAYNDTYESTPFIVMCESAYYGIFYLLMQHN